MCFILAKLSREKEWSVDCVGRSKGRLMRTFNDFKFPVSMSDQEGESLH